MGLRVCLTVLAILHPLAIQAFAQRFGVTDAPEVATATTNSPNRSTSAGESELASLEIDPTQDPATTPGTPVRTPQTPTTATPRNAAAAALPGASPIAANNPFRPPTTAAQRFSFQPGTAGTLAGLSRSSDFVMIGDLGPLASRRLVPLQSPGLPNPFPPPRPPNVPGARFATMLVPTMRSVKVSENQSPRPQDRIYYSFNYFDGVNDSVNDRLGAPVNNMRVFRSIWGFEKTFNDGLGSIGLRIPLNTLTADQTAPRSLGNFGGTHSALGNLNIIGKYALLENTQTGNLLSGGLVISPPTGPSNFAGANYFQSYNSTTFQPFLGYIWGSGDFYLHGFSGLDVPTDTRDVTLMYNDFGVGYFLRRDGPNDPERFVTMIAPTFEVHVNTPLNHRGAFNPFDPAATPDIVNLTYALNVGFKPNSLLSVGFVTPVTGPQPFDFEFMALLNVYFGGPKRNQTPPVLGGF